MFLNKGLSRLLRISFWRQFDLNVSIPLNDLVIFTLFKMESKVEFNAFFSGLSLEVNDDRFFDLKKVVREDVSTLWSETVEDNLLRHGKNIIQSTESFGSKSGTSEYEFCLELLIEKWVVNNDSVISNSLFHLSISIVQVNCPIIIKHQIRHNLSQLLNRLIELYNRCLMNWSVTVITKTLL